MLDDPGTDPGFLTEWWTQELSFTLAMASIGIGVKSVWDFGLGTIGNGMCGYGGGGNNKRWWWYKKI